MSSKNSNFEKLIEIIKTLRGENGCAWDKKQTFNSLVPLFLEESYELTSAISNKDYDNIREELGDLLLHIVFFSELANELDSENKFNIEDVLKEINEKLIRRHPHVFGDSKVDTVDGVLKQWEEIKKEEKKDKKFQSILDDIPISLPEFEKSYKLMKKASSVGFEYPDIKDSIKKIDEELEEVKEAFLENDKEHLEEEIGDLIMVIIDFARMAKINPINSLIRCNNKFKRRFAYIEKKAKEMNKPLEELTLKEMDDFWNEYKSHHE